MPEADSDLTLSAVTTREALEPLLDAWQDLFLQSSPQSFCLDPYWCLRMWDRQADAPGHRPAVIVGHAGGRLCLVWPLVTHRARLWRVARGLSGNLADYDDLLVATGPDADAWCRQAWDFAVGTLRPDMMLFRRVREGGGLDRLVAAGMALSERRSYAPCIDLRAIPDWESHFGRVDAKLRTVLRRGLRRLAADGEPRFEAVEDEARGLALIEWAHRQKHERLGSHAHNKREKTEVLGFGRDLPFLIDVAGHAFRQGRLKVLCLTAGDRTVAVNLMLVDHERVVGWLYGFDDAYRRAGPGQIVVMKAIAWAWETGAAVLDMMPEPEPSKLKWATGRCNVRDIRVATTAWGRVLVAWHRSSIRGLGLALYMRAPRPVQRAIRRLFR